MVCPKKGEKGKADIWCQKDYLVGSIPGFYGEIPGLPPLSSMVIKDGVASANTAISNNNLEYIVLPDNAKAIADKGFYKKGIRTLYLNNGLQKIGAGAFGGNERLREVTIPASVKEIGRLAFIACDLKQLEFEGNNITEIGERAFAWNDKLTVKGLDRIPLQVIAEDAFDDSDVTFILDPSEAEYLEYAKKIGAKVIDRNGELING